MSIENLFGIFLAFKLYQPHVVFDSSIQRHADFPGASEDFRIVDGRVPPMLESRHAERRANPR